MLNKIMYITTLCMRMTFVNKVYAAKNIQSAIATLQNINNKTNNRFTTLVNNMH